MRTVRIVKNNYLHHCKVHVDVGKFQVVCVFAQRIVRPMIKLTRAQRKKHTKNQDPVVQSIVYSLTILLRHKFVKQISAKVTNTLLFFVEKM